jgi:hypothetical protein
MDKMNNSKGTPTKRTNDQNKINLDYDFNTEYGDGDIPDIDKPNSSNVIPDERPRKDGPGGE